MEPPWRRAQFIDCSRHRCEARPASGDEVSSTALNLIPLILGMFILGVYPTFVLNYFNGSAVQLLQTIQGLL